MEHKDTEHPFERRMVTVEDHPRIYIVPHSEQGERGLDSRRPLEARKEGAEAPVLFFGHHIGNLVDPGKVEAPELLSIDKELVSSLEVVRRKLQKPGDRLDDKAARMSKVEAKHRRFIEERNSAQEALFKDIILLHRELNTDLDAGDLLSLHDLMIKEINHERTCSTKGPFHELVECDVLTFLRRKAAEQSWQRLDDYLDEHHLSFPIPPSMEDPEEPERNERIQAERRRSAREEFLKMPGEPMAELLLGNVPAWVYSYPPRETYLWRLTVLQGAAAGMTANSFMKYLALWEENTSKIVKEIEKAFMEKIRGLRQRGEAATDLSEVFAISNELQRVATEEIPDYIFQAISAKLKNS